MRMPLMKRVDLLRSFWVDTGPGGKMIPDTFGGRVGKMGEMSVMYRCSSQRYDFVQP
ncbi:conserved protein of unknown function [Kyrpidia spormannii]|uniref:Uncharacterized protein n=2 Tax=Kyrpidia spormannii TaxID=2055160 RepID=A0ACA8Z6M6_9BACL|nr:conserved protein of unknown function [Kyrpidia spormannii]CAB3391469.1 conserved protein of unknown function [Kyrpidia spormannii]